CAAGAPARGLAGLAGAGLLDGPCAAPTLNPFMAEGPEHWSAVRSRLIELVCDAGSQARVAAALVPVERAQLLLPFTVADYVDFYSSLEHATNLGRLFRPDGDPLLPNWRHLPARSHSRAAAR